MLLLYASLSTPAAALRLSRTRCCRVHVAAAPLVQHGVLAPVHTVPLSIEIVRILFCCPTIGRGPTKRYLNNFNIHYE